MGLFREAFRWWAGIAIIATGIGSARASNPFAGNNPNPAIGFCEPMVPFATVEPVLPDAISPPVFMSAEDELDPLPNLDGRLGGVKDVCEPAQKALSMFATEHSLYRQMFSIVMADPSFRFVLGNREGARNFFYPCANQIVLSAKNLQLIRQHPESEIAEIRHEILHAFLHAYGTKLKKLDLVNSGSELSLLFTDEQQVAAKKEVHNLRKKLRASASNGKKKSALRDGLEAAPHGHYIQPMALEYKGDYYDFIMKKRKSLNKKSTCMLSDILHQPEKDHAVTVISEEDRPGETYILRYVYNDTVVHVAEHFEDKLNSIESGEVYRDYEILDEYVMAIVELFPADVIKTHAPTIYQQLAKMVEEMSSFTKSAQNTKATSRSVRFSEQSFTVNYLKEICELQIRESRVKNEKMERNDALVNIQVGLQTIAGFYNAPDAILADNEYYRAARSFIKTILDDSRWPEAHESARKLLDGIAFIRKEFQRAKRVNNHV